ncbi:MAG: SGNH/GDSL hydrolase family protein [Myxococcota bacterium]|nr:SGNH/GDSL hydrolase family protein [Myxococcota bacterium]
MRRNLFNLLLALLLLALLQELALRFFFPVPEVLGFGRHDYSPQDGARPGSALGHASFRWTSDPDGFSYVHRLNLYGFRDDEWRLRAGPGVTRVAFVGDSFVEGFSTDAESTLPASFARLAREAGLRLEALNLGVGGADLRGYARLLRDALPLFAPDDVVLVFYANDLVPTTLDAAALGERPAPRRVSAWTPRLWTLQAELRAGRRVARRWHEAPFDFLPAVPDPRNRFTREREAAVLDRYVEPAIARAMRGGRFNPALATWFPWASRALARPVDVTPLLRQLAERVDRDGTRLFLVYMPTKSQVSDRYVPYQQEYSPPGAAVPLTGETYQTHALWLARSCASLGVPFLDLTPALRALEASGRELYWRYDDHLRPEGYRVAAGEIFSWWRRHQGEPAG